MAADYYELLGVVAGTPRPRRSSGPIRRLARELHPDTNPDPAAEERFKEVTVAYEVLSDPERRRRYDRFGPKGSGGRGDPFGFGGGGSTTSSTPSSAVGSPFGGGGRRGPAGPPRGQDIEVVVDLDFERGRVRRPGLGLGPHRRRLHDLRGQRAPRPGTDADHLRECAGVGQVRRVRQTILGQMVTAGPCPRCAGQGKVITEPCPTCRGEGRTIEERATPSTSPPASTPARRSG